MFDAKHQIGLRSQKIGVLYIEPTNQSNTFAIKSMLLINVSLIRFGNGTPLNHDPTMF